MTTETPNQTHELAEWLKTHDCYSVQQVTVTIGRQKYHGCKYKQDRQPVEGARSKEPYTFEVFYLLGQLPPAYKRSSHVCFPWRETTRDDFGTEYKLGKREWYVAGFNQEQLQNDRLYKPTLTFEEKRRYSPFGDHFLLHPWSVPDDSPIDKYEKAPYKRIEMTVKFTGDK